MATSSLARAGTAGLLVAALGCGPGETESTVERPAEVPGPAPDARVEPEWAHLAGLGYTAFADEEVTDVGLTRIDDQRWSPGFTLITSLPHGAAYLVDPRGEVFHAWRLDGAKLTARAELLPDGDVLFVSLQEPAADGRAGQLLVRMGWNGEVRWSRDLGAHHDVRALPGGDIAVLTAHDRIVPAVHEATPIRDEHVTLVSPAGDVLASYSLWDMVAKQPALAQLCVTTFIRRRPESVCGAFIDLFHANSLESMARHGLDAEHGLFSPTHFLVSLCAQDSLAILDCDRGEVVWMWGRQDVEGCHEARLLPTGNVLLFDNGARDRDHSRLLEVDVGLREVVWEYTAPEPGDFYSKTCGTVQHLPNDNLLVGNSNSGEVFEVDREGRVVWRFVNPMTDASGHSGAVRATRYEGGYVDAIVRSLPE